MQGEKAQRITRIIDGNILRLQGFKGERLIFGEYIIWRIQGVDGFHAEIKQLQGEPYFEAEITGEGEPRKSFKQALESIRMDINSLNESDTYEQMYPAQTVYVNVLRTEPDRIFKLLENFRVKCEYEKTYQVLKGLHIQKISFDSGLQYLLSLSRWVSIGHVGLEPAPETGTWLVSVESYSLNWRGSIAWQIEVYKQGLNFLTSFVKEFEQRDSTIEESLAKGCPRPVSRGPNIRTQERYNVFSKLKMENPGWSQYKVALEARNELGEIVTGETVRNTYRLMGKKWERADRIR